MSQNDNENKKDDLLDNDFDLDLDDDEIEAAGALEDMVSQLESRISGDKKESEAADEFLDLVGAEADAEESEPTEKETEEKPAEEIPEEKPAAEPVDPKELADDLAYFKQSEKPKGKTVKKKKKSSRRSGIPGGAILVAVLAVIVLVVVIVLSSRKNADSSSDESSQSAASSAASEAVTEQAQSETAFDTSLVMNANSEINSLMQSYFAALQNMNMAQISEYVSDASALSEEKIQKTGQYIESYNNFNTYVHDGQEPDTYIVYICYQVKFRNIDTTAPDMQYYYVIRNEAGKLVICTDVDDETQAYIDQVTAGPEVQELIVQVNEQLESAINADSDLKDLVSILYSASETESALEETTAEMTAAETESEEEVSDEPTEEVPMGEMDADGFIVVYEEVTALEDVNVRDATDLENSNVLGMLSAGDTVIRTGYDETWSRIEFLGGTAYVHTEFLSE